MICVHVQVNFLTILFILFSGSTNNITQLVNQILSTQRFGHEWDETISNMYVTNCITRDCAIEQFETKHKSFCRSTVRLRVSAFSYNPITATPMQLHCRATKNSMSENLPEAHTCSARRQQTYGITTPDSRTGRVHFRDSRPPRSVETLRYGNGDGDNDITSQLNRNVEKETK